jgi:predicted nucleotidyltransferase
MSIKLGFKEKRKNILETELERIKSRIPALDVQKVISFGSLATGTVRKSSDIDLIIVKRSDKKFLDRMDEFYEKLDSKVSMDIMVYTPEEFERMSRTNTFIKRAIKEGKILYEAK